MSTITDDLRSKCDHLTDAAANEIDALESEVAALRAQLAQHKASLPTCEKHKPDRGARSGCVICAGHALSHALSRIDYACGEPNEMECSDYDLHQNESEVVKRVVALRAQLAARDADAELARSRYIVGWLDGYEFIGLPELALKRPNAKPVFQFNVARKEQSK